MSDEDVPRNVRIMRRRRDENAAPTPKPYFRPAIDRSIPAMKRAIAAAVKEALKPPPPGMVRISVSLTVTEAFLEDEVALGARLVKLAKATARRNP